MPSERPHWLASQGFGLICGQATVLLLAIGSVVLATTKQGASRGIHGDDVRAFFESPSPWHAWLYALLAVLTLYGVNIAWCTARSVLRRWRAGMRSPAAYATALMHVGFGVALLAHLVGGLGGVERGQVVLDGQWRSPGPGWEGVEARVERVETAAHPDGSPKRVRATVLTRQGERERAHVVAFNRPLSHGWGAELLLFQEHGAVEVATIAEGEDRCAVDQGRGCELPGGPLHVTQVMTGGGHWGPEPFAVVTDGRRQDFLVQGRPTRVGERTLTLERVEAQEAIALRGKRSPGAPIALLSVALFGLGIVLMGRRWL
jgi:hypothetical protein